MEEEKIPIKIEANTNSKDKSTNKTNENNEVVFTDKKDDIELIDELNNARKKKKKIFSKHWIKYSKLE